MKILKCAQSDKANSEKYLLMDGDRQIGYGYIIETEMNPIEIFVNEEERSNGYGKLLFKNLIQIAKENGKNALFFEIKRENYRFTNIVSSSGARRIGTNDGITKWVLPL